MDNRRLILDTLRVIEARLHDPLLVQELAAHAGYSLFHFTRLFQTFTGIPPGEYILRRKITSSALTLLQQPDRSLLDVALDYGFNHYETFTRAFRRCLGLSPAEMRKLGHVSMLPLLHPLREEDLPHLASINGEPPELIERGEIILQGAAVSLQSDISVISAAWSRLFSKVSSISGRLVPERYYQVGCWSNTADSGVGTAFLCACELDSNSINAELYPRLEGALLCSASEQDANSGSFPIFRIPPARYAKFLHRGPSQEVASTYKYIYGLWLPKTEYRLSLPFEFEFYGPAYLGPHHKDSVSEIYIPLSLL
ncbi:helix-turn-helix domain-containing protein [Paenibacillus sp. CN-4]|uniref:helix-turn-helix domain-containing protein n=1 Tax=Paenibacillus nanchangensis TaxID=3348343 RepID=UPI00397B6557